MNFDTFQNDTRKSIKFGNKNKLKCIKTQNTNQIRIFREIAIIQKKCSSTKKLRI